MASNLQQSISGVLTSASAGVGLAKGIKKQAEKSTKEKTLFEAEMSRKKADIALKEALKTKADTASRVQKQLATVKSNQQKSEQHIAKLEHNRQMKETASKIKVNEAKAELLKTKKEIELKKSIKKEATDNGK